MSILERKLSDVGTREQHLMDLLKTWELVLEASEGVPAYRRAVYTNLERLLANLPGAIEELKATMHKMPDYREAFYFEEMKKFNDNVQPVAPNCPIDGHSHKRGDAICVGCQKLTGWVPPQQTA